MLVTRVDPSREPVFSARCLLEQHADAGSDHSGHKSPCRVRIPRAISKRPKFTAKGASSPSLRTRQDAPGADQTTSCLFAFPDAIEARAGSDDQVVPDDRRGCQATCIEGVLGEDLPLGIDHVTFALLVEAIDSIFGDHRRAAEVAP